MTIPAIHSLGQIFFNEDECIAFLLSKNVLYNSVICSSCSSEMKLEIARRSLRCRRKSCRKEESIRKYSFFFVHKLPCSVILHIGYLWLSKVSISSAISITGSSSHTVCNFYNYFRELVAESLDAEDCVIGGDGIIVEIDETKLGTRKYNRGHRVDGVWVVGGIEKIVEGKIFIAKVEDRSQRSLLKLILEHVRPGSIIHTDMWKGYNGLDRCTRYEHLTVNHSENFKDPHTGVHTNTIEGTWNGLKMQIKPRNRTSE